MKKLENAFKVAEHTDAMLAYWDKDLVCRFANSSYIKWFGMSPADMIDKMTLPVLLGPLYEKNVHYIKRALQGKRQVFERDIQLPGGDVKTTIATYTPEIVEGKVMGFYAHVADISPVKNESIIREYVVDYPGMTVGHNYLNGIEHTLRSSIFTKFPGLQAKQFFVSPTKLKKDFKAQYNNTIFWYYRSLQMQVAEKYIQGKIYSKKQLAEMFEFDNVSNFSNRYKKYISEKANALPGVLSSTAANPGILPITPQRPIFTPSFSNNHQEDNNQLVEKIEFMQQCFAQLQIGTWERNFETSETIWNKMARQILELPADFEPDFTPHLHFYKEGKDRELAQKCLHEAYIHGKSFDFTARLITARGTEKNVRVLGFCHFEKNVCKKMCGTFQEIS